MYRQMFITTKKKNVIEKKKLKSLIGFHGANKVDNYYNGGGEGKKSKRFYRTSQKIIINVFLESLLSKSFPSLGVTVHLTSLDALHHHADL